MWDYCCDQLPPPANDTQVEAGAQNLPPLRKPEVQMETKLFLNNSFHQALWKLEMKCQWSSSLPQINEKKMFFRKMEEWIFPIFYFSFSQWKIELISVKRTLTDCFHGGHIDQKLPGDTCIIDKTDEGGLKFWDLNGVETSLVPLC